MPKQQKWGVSYIWELAAIIFDQHVIIQPTYKNSVRLADHDDVNV